MEVVLLGGRQKLPIEVIQARGNYHITKEEISRRKNQEVKPITDEIDAPSYLTKKQKEAFDKYASQLQKLKIMGETDVDALARYVISFDLYLESIKQLKKREVKNNPDLMYKWSIAQDRYFKQCRACASDLGLTIASRCKLVIPEANQDKTKTNKFNKFEKGGVG